MKKIVFIILAVVGVLGAFALYYIAQGFMDAARHGGSPAALERRLVEISEKLNQGLPRQAGELTRLEKTIPGPGLRLTYVYKFPDHSRAEVDPAKLATVGRSKAMDAYKQMADFRKWQVELRYEYVDKDGNKITTITISPQDL